MLSLEKPEYCRILIIEIPKNQIVAFMGPSGCGKTTFLRCINRLHELTPGARTEGKIYFFDDDIYKLNLILLRRKIGMVFQRPNPFPTMSIFENVISGYTLNGIKLSKSAKRRNSRRFAQKSRSLERSEGYFA